MHLPLNTVTMCIFVMNFGPSSQEKQTNCALFFAGALLERHRAMRNNSIAAVSGV